MKRSRKRQKKTLAPVQKRRRVAASVHSSKAGARTSREPERASTKVVTPVAPELRRTLAGVTSATLLLLVAIPGGPFAFLPAAFRWPAAMLAVLGLWLPLASSELRSDRRLPKILEAAGLSLVFGTYVLLKLVGLHASGTDDNIYFYFAARVAQGAVPYRDFFFAHPPMHLLVPAAIFKLTGFSVLAAKSIPALAQAIAGLFVYLTVRRASRSLALCTLALHLGAYQVLMGSTDMNGENIMAAFLFAALFLAVRGRHLAAGVLAGLGLGTGMYALAAVLTLGVACGFTSRRALGRYVLGAVASFGGLVVVFRLIGGPQFIEGVFTYHFAKRAAPDRLPVFGSLNPFSMVGALGHNLANYLGSDEFQRQLYFHAPLYLAAVASLALLAGTATNHKYQNRRADALALLSPRDLLSGSAEGLAKLGLLGVALFLTQWGGLNEIYDFYSVPMVPFLAMAAGFGLWRIYLLAARASAWREMLVPALLLAGLSLHLPLASRINHSLWPDEQRDRGTVVRYEWREPAGLGGLAGLTRALFFAEQRVKGEVSPPFRHYMWNKMLTFSTAEELAAYVRANTAPDETITGASTLAPLVALLAGRRMAGDEADTNNKRFTSGLLTDEQFFARVCRDKLRYVLGAPRSRFMPPFMAQNPTTSRYFVPEHEVTDSTLLHFGRAFPITLYRRQDVDGLPDGMVCDVR